MTAIEQTVQQVRRKPGTAPRAVSRMARRQAMLGLLFVSPWIIGFVIFKLLPILASLAFSFTNFHAMERESIQFIGLDNYWRLLSDNQAGFSLFSTLSFGLRVIPAQLGVALLFAAFLSSPRVRAKRLLRSLIFLPSIIPGTAVFVVAFGFIDPSTGWLNRLILEPLGLRAFEGPNSEAGYYFILTLIALWTIGPTFMIMLAAMRGIPHELYEAARVDGAGPINRFANVTLPMVSPAIFFSLIISLVSIFGGAALLDQGTTFSGGISAYDNYISAMIFSEFEIGYAAALAWAFFLLMIAVIVVLFRTARYWVYYPEGEA
jgi:ABC-type sugar transport system permease subunit